MDRTTSPWRALEDPGGAAPEPVAPAHRLSLAPHHLLLGGLLGLAIVVAVALVLMSSSTGALVSISTAGGDSPSIGPGDGSSVAAGGDGGGPSGQAPDGSPDTAVAGAVTAASSAPDLLVVEVAGAVERPGLYRLAPGSR
ncbi:MAG TPA: hypothetical protein VKR24_11040, partial [Candidatus Limnocylindrales bacterium]|nr:hypothetical protein [Candidatus Limnocylindrales bacterium]